MNVKCLECVIGVLNLSFVIRKGVYIDNPSKIWLLEPLSGSPMATGTISNNSQKSCRMPAHGRDIATHDRDIGN